MFSLKFSRKHYFLNFICVLKSKITKTSSIYKNKTRVNEKKQVGLIKNIKMEQKGCSEGTKRGFGCFGHELVVDDGNCGGPSARV